MSRPENPCVLLVDDNDATRTLVTAILQRDFVVEVAGDGFAALEKLKTGNYDAVLLDLRMPQLDGFGVLEHLKANRPELLPRIIVLTAALTRGEIDRVKAYEICGIMAKPFDVETLLAAVKSCVDPGGRPFGSVISSGMILVAGLLSCSVTWGH
jgi:DNA-binding response OmpR family regulator